MKTFLAWVGGVSLASVFLASLLAFVDYDCRRIRAARIAKASRLNNAEDPFRVEFVWGVHFSTISVAYKDRGGVRRIKSAVPYEGYFPYAGDEAIFVHAPGGDTPYITPFKGHMRVQDRLEGRE